MSVEFLDLLTTLRYTKDYWREDDYDVEWLQITVEVWSIYST